MMTTTSGDLMVTDTEQYFRGEERSFAGASVHLTVTHFDLSALARVKLYARYVTNPEMTACLEALQQLAAYDLVVEMIEFYAQHVVPPEMTACLEALQQLTAYHHASAMKKLENTQSSFITMAESAARIDAGEISVAEAMIAFHAARIFAGAV